MSWTPTGLLTCLEKLHGHYTDEQLETVWASCARPRPRWRGAAGTAVDRFPPPPVPRCSLLGGAVALLLGDLLADLVHVQVAGLLDEVLQRGLR